MRWAAGARCWESSELSLVQRVMVVDIVGMRHSADREARAPGSVEASWWAAVLVGAAAFWIANFAISLTGIAAEYRAAVQIHYLPMLMEAAVGGAIVAAAVAFALARAPDRVPGRGPVAKASVLAAGVLVLVTLLVEVPSKLGSAITDTGYWLAVATVFNAIRILAAGVAIGLFTRSRTTRSTPAAGNATREEVP